MNNKALLAFLTFMLVLCCAITTIAKPSPSTEVTIDHVTLLLPSPSCSNVFKPISHTLNARGGSGCFRWHTTHPHLISVTESTDPATVCTVNGVKGTTQAHVSVVYEPQQSGKNTAIPDSAIAPDQHTDDRGTNKLSNSAPSRQSAWAWAEDISTNKRAECEVYLDTIHSLFIKTSTKRINLGDVEMLAIQAYDDHHDVFSSTEGMIFNWSILSDKVKLPAPNQQSQLANQPSGGSAYTDDLRADANYLPINPHNYNTVTTSNSIAIPVSLLEANLDITPTRSAMTTKNYGTDLLLIQGVNSGRTSFQVKYYCQASSQDVITATVDIVVTEPLAISPPLLRMCHNSQYVFQLYTRHAKSLLLDKVHHAAATDGGNTSFLKLITLPQDSLQWKTSSQQILRLDNDRTGAVTSQKLGYVKLSVIDVLLLETSVSTDVIVVEPYGARLLMYYYDDDVISDHADLNEQYSPAPFNLVNKSYNDYIALYKPKHHGKSTLTTIPVEKPYSPKPNDSSFGYNNSNLLLTGNIHVSEVDVLINNPEQIQRARFLHLQPQCNNLYHLSTATTYTTRLVLLDQHEKPIDVCDDISIEISYDTTPSQPQKISFDAYGFFSFTTPQTTGRWNTPLRGQITIKRTQPYLTQPNQYFTQVIPFQVDPDLHITNTATPAASAQFALTTAHPLIFPASNTSMCTYDLFAHGGSGSYYWTQPTRNASLQGKKGTMQQFINISNQSEKLQTQNIHFSTTVYTGTTKLTVRDQCNPLYRAVVIVETSLPASLCIAPHTNEILLPTPTITNQLTTPVDDSARFHYFIADVQGRLFTDSKCIALLTTLTSNDESDHDQNSQALIVSPVSTQAHYLPKCTPTTSLPTIDIHNKASFIPVPAAGYFNQTIAQKNIIDVGCYEYIFKPTSTGFVRITTTPADSWYQEQLNKYWKQTGMKIDINELSSKALKVVNDKKYLAQHSLHNMKPFAGFPIIATTIIGVYRPPTITPAPYFASDPQTHAHTKTIYALYNAPFNVYVSYGPLSTPVDGFINTNMLAYTTCGAQPFTLLPTASNPQVSNLVTRRLNNKYILTSEHSIDSTITNIKHTLPATVTIPANTKYLKIDPTKDYSRLVSFTCLPLSPSMTPPTNATSLFTSTAELSIVTYNKPSVYNPYPHHTETISTVQCFQPVCPTHRHVNLIIHNIDTVTFQNHVLQDKFVYTIVDTDIATLVSTNGNIVAIKGNRVGITVMTVDVIIDGEMQHHMRSFVIIQVLLGQVNVVGNTDIIPGEDGIFTIISNLTSPSSTDQQQHIQYVSASWYLLPDEIAGNNTAAVVTTIRSDVMLQPIFSSPSLQISTPQPQSLYTQIDGLSVRLLTTDDAKPGKYQLVTKLSTAYPTLSAKTLDLLQVELAKQHVASNLHQCAHSLQSFVSTFITNQQKGGSIEQQTLTITQSTPITIMNKIVLQSPSTLYLPVNTQIPIVTAWAHSSSMPTSSTTVGKKVLKAANSLLSYDVSNTNALHVSAVGMIQTKAINTSSLIDINHAGTKTRHFVKVDVSTPSFLDLIPAPSLLTTSHNADTSAAAQSLLFGNNMSFNGVNSVFNTPLCPSTKKITPELFSLVARDINGHIYNSIRLAASTDKKATITVSIDKPKYLNIIPQHIDSSFTLSFPQAKSTPTPYTSFDDIASLSQIASFVLQPLPNNGTVDAEPQDVTITFVVDVPQWNTYPLVFHARFKVGNDYYCEYINTPSTTGLLIQQPATVTKSSRQVDAIAPSTPQHVKSHGLRLTVPLNEQFIANSLHSTKTALPPQQHALITNSIHRTIYNMFINSVTDVIQQISLQHAKQTIPHPISIPTAALNRTKFVDTNIVYKYLAPHIHIYIKHVDFTLNIALIDVVLIQQDVANLVNSHNTTITSTLINNHAVLIQHPHQWYNTQVFGTSPDSSKNTPNISLLPLELTPESIAQAFSANFAQTVIYNHFTAQNTTIITNYTAYNHDINQFLNNNINLIAPAPGKLLNRTVNNKYLPPTATFSSPQQIFAVDGEIAYIDIVDFSSIVQLLLAQQFKEKTHVNDHLITVQLALKQSPQLHDVKEINANTKLTQKQRDTILSVTPLVYHYNIHFNQLPYTIYDDAAKAAQKQHKLSNTDPILTTLYPLYSPFTQVTSTVQQTEFVLNCLLLTYQTATFAEVNTMLSTLSTALRQPKQLTDISILSFTPPGQPQYLMTTSLPSDLPQHQKVAHAPAFMCPGVLSTITTAVTVEFPAPQQNLWAVSQHYITALLRRYGEYNLKLQALLSPKPCQIVHTDTSNLKVIIIGSLAAMVCGAFILCSNFKQPKQITQQSQIPAPTPVQTPEPTVQLLRSPAPIRGNRLREHLTPAPRMYSDYHH